MSRVIVCLYLYLIIYFQYRWYGTPELDTKGSDNKSGTLAKCFQVSWVKNLQIKDKLYEVQAQWIYKSREDELVKIGEFGYLRPMQRWAKWKQQECKVIIDCYFNQTGILRWQCCMLCFKRVHVAKMHILRCMR